MLIVSLLIFAYVFVVYFRNVALLLIFLGGSFDLLSDLFSLVFLT